MSPYMFKMTLLIVCVAMSCAVLAMMVGKFFGQKFKVRTVRSAWVLRAGAFFWMTIIVIRVVLLNYRYLSGREVFSFNSVEILVLIGPGLLLLTYGFLNNRELPESQ